MICLIISDRKEAFFVVTVKNVPAAQPKIIYITRAEERTKTSTVEEEVNITDAEVVGGTSLGILMRRRLRERAFLRRTPEMTRMEELPLPK